MERVQFQQEQMLAELKDLAEKNIFTQKEIKQIMKKNTAFETALVRRVPKKADFLRYASYAMGLEHLRRKRVERQHADTKPPPSISDYALVRRVFQIFERALKKFGADVGLWVQYIQVAKREGARALVGRVSARALQLHPNVPALYILSASHELDHLSPAAARALLQRGLRLNADSVEMWTEYVKMEMGFVEGLRRRWGILGVDIGKGKGKGKSVDTDMDVLGEGGDVQRMEEDADEEGDQGDAVRREIMEGAIVKSVVSSAVKALPTLPLFSSLYTLLATYPAPPALRDDLISYLRNLFDNTLSHEPRAVTLLLDQTTLDGEELVDALRDANSKFTEGIKNAEDKRREDWCVVYGAFVTKWCTREETDLHLRAYLTSTLRALIKSQSTPSPALSAAHITTLTFANTCPSPELFPSSSPEKILRLARRYTAASPTSGKLWLARLDAESRFANTADTTKAWTESRKSVYPLDPAVEDVWTWGLDHLPEQGTTVLEGLLAESMRDASLAPIHESLLLRWAAAPHAESHHVRRMAGKWHVTGRVWAEMFAVEARADEPREDVLKQVYEHWRSIDAPEATLRWAGWLLGKGRGDEAVRVITSVVGSGASFGAKERGELERRWREIVDGETDELNEADVI
ncbi:hypothetical protein PLICRDRAFT_103628 [Plicaturopsis crispa FD-325 SS-3]|nr:hypothetical protein PLICRDRAFT_103628 [Plicaturopsis crispa FD-325 SS-3]